MTSVLKRVAERFDPNSVRSGQSSGLIKKVNAKGAFRLAGAKIKSTITHHAMKPRDLWEPKSIVGWGLDTRFYSDQMTHGAAHRSSCMPLPRQVSWVFNSAKAAVSR